MKFSKKQARWKPVLPVIFLTCFLFSFVASFHAYYVSVTHMQQNSKDKTFEVSIRIFTDDLEKALSADNGNKRVTLKNNDGNESLVEKYLRKHFVLTGTNGQPIAFTFVGKENEDDVTWVYVEYRSLTNLAGYTVSNNLLMETFDDQVNMLNVKMGSDKKTYLLKKGKHIQKL